MVEGRTTFLPQFISAGTPLGLRRRMLTTNARYGMQVAYFGIQFAQGKWWAWFNLEIQNDDPLLTDPSPTSGKSGE